MMRRDFLIDHRLLFLFGYCFYLFTPILVGTTEIFNGLPGIELYRTAFALVPDAKLGQYLLISALWLPCFFLGNFLFDITVKKKTNIELFPASISTYSVSYIGILLFLVLIVFTYLGRQSLFGGYDSYDISARGKMSTLLMIYNFFLLYQLISRQRVSLMITIGTALCCLFLLSMGGRMYVFHTFVIILIFKTSFSESRWKLRNVFLFGLLGLFIASLFGLWRMGSSVGFEKAAYSLMAEPAFTWFSTISYLVSNDIPYFNFPSNFVTSFLNLIPNTFFSLKPYVVSTASMVKDYQNPLGADSVWSTFVINFGSIGSCLFLFITGFVLNFLKYKSYRSRFWGVYYIMICGLLPFQFFRDGFYILNKQIIFNFLLLPAVILSVFNFLMHLSRISMQTELEEEAGMVKS